MAARNALIRHLRVYVKASLLKHNIGARESALPFTVLLRRFSDEVRGSFLDKSDVTDRVISVLKNFQRVDPSKCTSQSSSFHQVRENSLHFSPPPFGRDTIADIAAMVGPSIVEIDVSESICIIKITNKESLRK
ncbi:hypothetical protein EUTSA_v10009290mg [Eutrema salsugineum]|uniref:Uncharacterized protein n=1 Tax=Eutrema salsugineum TaxID=72664 RepID=V4L2A5_EUTSA|nr:hypothetical protein EUTSA_v10009290mg [Eutrema salsugineum]